MLVVSSDRGVGQRPLVQLPSVLHGVFDQSGLALHPLEPLCQQQSSSPERLTTPQSFQGLCQEGPAALGPGTVPQVSAQSELNGINEQRCIYISVVWSLCRVTFIYLLVKALKHL